MYLFFTLKILYLLKILSNPGLKVNVLCSLKEMAFSLAELAKEARNEALTH